MGVLYECKLNLDRFDLKKQNRRLENAKKCKTEDGKVENESNRKETFRWKNGM